MIIQNADVLEAEDSNVITFSLRAVTVASPTEDHRNVRLRFRNEFQREGKVLTCTHCNIMNENIAIASQGVCPHFYLLHQTYTEIPEVLIVVQSITHQEGIWHLKANICNK